MNTEPQKSTAAPEPAMQSPTGSVPPQGPTSNEPRTSGSAKWLMIALAVVIVVAVLYILIK